MPKYCWEIMVTERQSEGFCESCPAFLAQRNCWEVAGTPCSTNAAVCILIDCPVYRLNKKEIEKLVRDGEIDKTLQAIQAVAQSRCWQVTDCPPMRRAECLAYLRNKNCFEVDSCGCREEDPKRCLVCPVNVYRLRFSR